MQVATRSQVEAESQLCGWRICAKYAVGGHPQETNPRKASPREQSQESNQRKQSKTAIKASENEQSLLSEVPNRAERKGGREPKWSRKAPKADKK